VGFSLIQTADQARGKVGVVKWACAYGVVASAKMEARAKAELAEQISRLSN